MCSNYKDRGFECTGVFPQVMNVYRARGSTFKESAINGIEEEAIDVVHSTTQYLTPDRRQYGRN